MNEDNTTLDNKCVNAKKPAVKVGHIQKLMRIYRPLLKATGDLQTQLYAGQSPSNDFTRAHFDEIKELINYSATLGLACEKQANLLNQYAPAKQYLSGLAVKVNYTGKNSTGKKLRVLSTEWCKGLEKAIRDSTVTEFRDKVAKMDVEFTEFRRELSEKNELIEEQAKLIERINEKLDVYVRDTKAKGGN